MANLNLVFFFARNGVLLFSFPLNLVQNTLDGEEVVLMNSFISTRITLTPTTHQ